jgi:hypothetical protein
VNASRGAQVAISGGTVVTGVDFIALHARQGASITLTNAAVENNEGKGLPTFQGGSIQVNQGGVVRKTETAESTPPVASPRSTAGASPATTASGSRATTAAS